MIPKVLSQSLLVARIRGESSFSSLYSSSLDCLCLSLGFRISFCFMCLWLWMCWLLRQSWCECASVCLCASVCVYGGVPVWVGSRSHRILPTSSLFASAQHNYLNKNTKIQKEIRKPPLSLPLYNSVILDTKTPRPSTNQRTSSHFTIIQSEQNPSQWHLCSSYRMTAVKMGATYTSILILLHLCCAHLSPLFDQRRKYCRVWPGST